MASGVGRRRCITQLKPMTYECRFPNRRELKAARAGSASLSSNLPRPRAPPCDVGAWDPNQKQQTKKRKTMEHKNKTQYVIRFKRKFSDRSPLAVYFCKEPRGGATLFPSIAAANKAAKKLRRSALIVPDSVTVTKADVLAISPRIKLITTTT